MRLKPSYPRLRQGHPLAVGLASAWPFHDGSGNQLTDVSNVGNVATLQSGSTWANGNNGPAVAFDGTGDGIQSTNSDGFQPGGLGWTIASWIQPTNRTANRTIVSNWAANGTFSSLISSDVSSILDDGNFHFVAASVIKGSTLAATICVDGVIVGSGNLTAGHDRRTLFRYNTAGTLSVFGGTIDSKGTLNIGQTAHIGSNRFLGNINSVLLWNRGLSSQEVGELYADPFAMFRPRQRSYFAMAGVNDWVLVSDTILGSDRIYTDELLDAGVTYEYIMEAIYADGESTSSNIAEATTSAAGTTVTPGTASLTITPFAPTVTASDAVTVTPTTASLTITPLAPTVTATANQTFVPGVATLSLSALAPTVTVTANQTFVPGVATLSLSALAPTVTVTANVVVVPDVASLTVTPFAPTAAISDVVVITPGTASLTLTPFAPTVTASDAVTVVPAAASLNLTPFAPTVTAISEPTDVVATALSSSSIGLSWTHPGGAVTFELQRRVKVGA